MIKERSFDGSSVHKSLPTVVCGGFVAAVLVIPQTSYSNTEQSGALHARVFMGLGVGRAVDLDSRERFAVFSGRLAYRAVSRLRFDLVVGDLLARTNGSSHSYMGIGVSWQLASSNPIPVSGLLYRYLDARSVIVGARSGFDIKTSKLESDSVMTTHSPMFEASLGWFPAQGVDYAFGFEVKIVATRHDYWQSVVLGNFSIELCHK